MQEKKVSNKNLNQNLGFIWDIDGVVVDSPHEEAWRTVLESLGVHRAKFNSKIYLELVAGRKREENIAT